MSSHFFAIYPNVKILRPKKNAENFEDLATISEMNTALSNPNIIRPFFQTFSIRLD